MQVHKFKFIMANSKPQRVKIFECSLPRGWKLLHSSGPLCLTSAWQGAGVEAARLEGPAAPRTFVEELPPATGSFG